MKPAYENSTFFVRDDSAQPIREVVERECASRQALRILDLGCGTGDTAANLAATGGDHVIDAIDISAENILLAKAHHKSLMSASQLRFSAANYRDWPPGAYDIIFADSVLHLLEMESAEIYAKFAADTASSGMLVVTLPVDSLQNRLLVLFRASWRCTPRAFDRLALFFAKRFYSKEAAEILASRIMYMRVLPRRLFGKSMLRSLKQVGFSLETQTMLPRVSFWKPEHVIAVLRKDH